MISLNPFKKQKKAAPSQTAQPALNLPDQQQKFSEGLTSTKDIIAPPSLDVDFTFLKIGNTFFRTLFVAGYPRFVNANWLSPLINFNHTLDIAMYTYPIEGKGVLEDLKRKIGEMEAEIQTDLQRGRIANIDTQVKLEDARGLQEQLAKGSERFFQFGLYITLKTDNEKELETITKQVQSTLGSLLIVSKVAALQMGDAFKTVLPYCQDKLMINRNMDTTSLASTFPFTSSELTANEGVMYGLNQHNGSLIIFDRFSLENANSVVFAKSGAGKSVGYNETVLIKNAGNKIKRIKIGPLVEKIIEKRGFVKIDKEMEGCIDPNLKVYSFNPKTLKNSWSAVTAAARKKSPKILYKFTTKSGREITTTGDHNILILKDGNIVLKQGRQIKAGDVLPIARAISFSAQPTNSLYLLSLLKKRKKIYVYGANKILKRLIPFLGSKKIDPCFDRYLYRYAKKRGIPLSYFLKIARFFDLSQKQMSNIVIGSRIFNLKTSLPIHLSFSAELSRILGYIAAEGCTANNCVSISTTSLEIKNDIVRCFNKLNLSIFFVKNRAVLCGARVFVELIKALGGVNQKSHKKHAPSILFNSSPEIAANFLKAYFSGDGNVGNHEVSATTKSKRLSSDLTYLLSFFGIVSRTRKVFKKAANSAHKGSYYYNIVISGQKNLRLFASQINFTASAKRKRLNLLIKNDLNENTNVDLVPELKGIFQELYQLLYLSSEITSPACLSALKSGAFNPSRPLLKTIVKQFQNRVKELKSLKTNLDWLKQLPHLSPLIQAGIDNKNYNACLWREMGQSWRLMKQRQVKPGIISVLRAYYTVSGHKIESSQIYNVIYQSFESFGESLQAFSKSLWTAIVCRKGDTDYENIRQAIRFLELKYKESQLKIARAEHLIRRLKIFANSGLFWDPIAKIEKLPSKRQYVYDLQVKNGVFLAGHGGLFVHNSYMIKLEALRSLMFDTEIIVVDPENEYQALSEVVGGEYITFSFNSPAKINPFDLSQVYEEGENELGLKILSLHSLFKIIMGEMTPEEEAILDRALVLTYKQKGITPDPSTQKNEPPLMEDLYKALIGMEEPQSNSLAARLEKFIKGSLRGIFDQRTTVDIKNPFTVFSIKELENELRPIAMFIILDYIWTKVKKDLKKRLLIVDEAWYLMKHPDSATFLYGMAKRARKYYLGVTTITQDVEDFLNSDYGKAIVTNSSIQILMKQSPAAIDKIGDVFYLSQGEKNLLLAAGIGEGLFFAGPNHVAMRVVASKDEHLLATSKPDEVLAIREGKSVQASSVPKTPDTSTLPPQEAWNKEA